jgi:tetratricopeptide (TPR) repeat protein
MAGMKIVWTMLLVAMTAGAQVPVPQELVNARAALTAKDFARARAGFSAFARAHPMDARAPLGLGDVALAEHQYEAAELAYRQAVALEPQLWPAHKDLVLVEARLHRWEEFDRERAVLRGARARGAAGITAEESDLIDTFSVNGREWLVREYAVPLGRAETRYNFEHFSPEGKVEEYISLEPTAAAAGALKRDESVRIGADKAQGAAASYSLIWYTARGHGVVRTYAKGEPAYEAVRGDVVRYLEKQR